MAERVGWLRIAAERPLMYRVVIGRVEDGLERVCEQPFDWVRDGDDDWTWWAYGNMACDCNRALEFARAAGEPEPFNLCCSDGRYQVLQIELPDGTVIKGPDADD